MSSDETTTTSVGQQIKADREATGMTIEQLAQATRIMVTFVEALERDDISALPGKVFGKGFIKSIYKVLGKDPEGILRQFDAVNGIDQTRVVPVTQVEPLRTDIVRRESEARHLPMQVVIGTSIVGIGLVALIWYFSAQSGMQQETVFTEEPATQADEEASIEPATQADEEASIEPAEENTVDEDVVATVQNVDAEPKVEIAHSPSEQVQTAPDVAAMQADASTNQAQLLEITVRKKVKIRMNFDQKGWETNELTPDTYQFRFEDAANLLLFNAAAVEMSFNGKNLGRLGDEGRVRRLTFVAGSPQTKGQM